MTLWHIILLIYTLIGGLAFLGVFLFFAYISYASPAEYYGDYYYPNHNKGNSGVTVSITVGLLIGVSCGLLWPFILLLLLGAQVFTIGTKEFSRLMTRLTTSKEGGGRNDE